MNVSKVSSLSNNFALGEDTLNRMEGTPGNIFLVLLSYLLLKPDIERNSVERTVTDKKLSNATAR